MKKIISFGLWGNDPKYTVGAIRNAELIKSIYPGWIARFYIGKNTERSIGRRLIALGAEVVNMNVDGDWTTTFWRFYPAGESDVEVMISRDTDSRLNFREKACVDEWLLSNKPFHIMRDHPAHTAVIMAGMWGVKHGFLKDIKSQIESYAKSNFKQLDQTFLHEKIYSLVKNDALVHDEFFEKKPFPTERHNYEFVGDVFDENDVRHPEYWKDFVKK